MSRVLIVEDDPLVVAMLRYNLDSAGYEVLVAGDVEKGWRSIYDKTPDAIILDISLPGATGWELLEGLRADERFHRIPVVVTTGLPPEEVRARANGLLSDYLPKPYEPSDLLERVDRILKDAYLFFGNGTTSKAEKIAEAVPMDVVLLLDGYKIEGVIHVPARFDRFSDAWESLMNDERAFIPVTAASVFQDGGHPIATPAFLEVSKRDIRALFGSSSGPLI